MSFLAPIFAFLVEIAKDLNLWWTELGRDQDRQAGADALASDIDAETVETADAQLANDRAARSVDDIADRLQLDADADDKGGGVGAAQTAVRSADTMDGGAKA